MSRSFFGGFRVCGPGFQSFRVGGSEDLEFGVWDFRCKAWGFRVKGRRKSMPRGLSNSSLVIRAGARFPEIKTGLS